MANIIPAIISRSFSEIKQKIDSVDALVSWVHVDIMDGKFVVPTTWNNPEDLKEVLGDVKIEVHLMVEHPEEVVSNWTHVADRLIVHLESTDHLDEIVDAMSSSHTKLGVAIELGTPIDQVFPYVDKVSVIQLMSIAEIGYHGHKFDDGVLGRIKTLRQRYPNVTIQVDGGINLDTGKQALSAGADNLIAGSAIWEASDLHQIISDFQNL